MVLFAISLIIGVSLVSIRAHGSDQRTTGSEFDVQFLCSAQNDVLLRFDGDWNHALPRITGVTETGLCDDLRLSGNDVQIYCGYQVPGPITIILEYDRLGVYSVGHASCPVRLVRDIFTVPQNATEDQFGKAKAKVKVNLDYNDISEIVVDCNSNGKVYVTNPDPVTYRHVLIYNMGGPLCSGVMVEESLVEITHCDLMRRIEIVFSALSFNSNIIGGSADMRIYKFRCDEINKEPLVFEEIEEYIQSVKKNGAARLVTCSTLLICIIGQLLNSLT